MDKMNLVVWIDNSHVPEREHAGRLCRRHADALVVPRDWTIDDRRQPIPLLFRTLVDNTTGTSRPRQKKATQRTRDNTEKLLRPSLFEEIEAEVNEALQAAEVREIFSEISEIENVPEVVPELATKESIKESPTIDPDETQAIPWSPRLGANAVPDDQPTPTFGRLLGRAFGQKNTEDE